MQGQLLKFGLKICKDESEYASAKFVQAYEGKEI